MLLWQKIVYLKVLLQMAFEIMTKSNPESLAATVDLPAMNLTQREEFHEVPLSSLSDYFWS